MRTHTQAFTVPKAGNSDEESQDRLFFDDRDLGYSDLPNQRFAISDGASESIFSGLWANLVARAWGLGNLDLANPSGYIASLSEQWLEAICSANVPWWAEQKIEQGSFATLIGLEIAASQGELVWRTQAIGDSCIFVLAEDRVVYSGPVRASIDFCEPPFLIGSNAKYNVSLTSNVTERCGTGGQEFLLMSDALACWFMRGIETGTRPSELLLPLETEVPSEGFLHLVSQARDSGQMRNDDTTLISVQVIAR